MDLKGTGSENAGWIQLAQNRVQWWAPMNMVMNLWWPFMTNWVTI